MQSENVKASTSESDRGSVAPRERVNVLGVGISVLNLEIAATAIATALDRRRKGYVCVTGVHGVMEAQQDPEMRAILNRAFLCTPDGMPMVWLGKWDGHKAMDRVYGPDLMERVCRDGVARGWRHFFYGGGPGVAEELEASLTKRIPGLRVAGTYCPPFRPLEEAEEDALARCVTEARPDVMWVGLSTPKQERFMARYLDRLETTLMVGVGAAFDFHSGRVRQAPRWMQRSGLEWLFRLSQEPRRLWRRYFRNNPVFVACVAGQKMGLKKYALE